MRRSLHWAQLRWGARGCALRRAEPVAKLDHFGLRGKPEVLKERSRNLRRAGEFFSSKGWLDGSERLRSPECGEAVSTISRYSLNWTKRYRKTLQKNFARKIGGHVLKSEAGRYGVEREACDGEGAYSGSVRNGDGGGLGG